MIRIEDQIREVKRELGQRAFVYPRLIANGRLTQKQADLQVARLEAVLATLERYREALNPSLPL